MGVVRCLFLLSYFLVSSQQYYTVYDNDGAYTLSPGKDSVNGVAWGFVYNEVNVTGWSRLFLETNTNMPVLSQMFGAGFLEGALTQELIFMSTMNNFQDVFNTTSTALIPTEVVQWVTANDEWIRQQASTHANASLYWQEVSLVVAQLDGLTAGYASAAPASEQLSSLDLLMMQLVLGDMSDLLPALTNPSGRPWDTWSKEEVFQEMTLHSHCSSLVKLNYDGSELFVGHNTWGDFASMLRMFKSYTYPRSNGELFTSLLSGYPGVLTSNDDYYMLKPANMIVTETTNAVMDDSLYKRLAPESVLYWIRSLVANRIANNASEWISTFEAYNSGTYNNQMILVDYKLFTPYKPLQPGTVMIVEQMPGQMFSTDVTDIVASKGYWPSFNRPFFEDVFDAMGYAYYTEKFGDIFSYYHTARYLIFQRDQHQVVAMADMRNLMMYNDWQNDPLSNGYAGDSIAARFDLEVAVQRPASWLMRGLHGNIDCKITSYYMLNASSINAISGPTHEQQVPFTWATPEWNQTLHLGHPLVFNFSWTVMTTMS